MTNKSESDDDNEPVRRNSSLVRRFSMAAACSSLRAAEQYSNEMPSNTLNTLANC